MRLTRRRLNRTLLARQHLLERVDSTPHAMVEHLVGLQAQDNLPPYLSLAARLRTFDPYDVSRALEDRSLVRLLTLRGTIHLLTPADALVLRPWVQPRMEQELRASNPTRPAAGVDRATFADALATCLSDGPLPQARLGEALASHFPQLPAGALGSLARLAAPLVQLPPRGTWRGSGGVVYEPVDRWLRAPLQEPSDDDGRGLVRRYLRAFGPASAADVTAWSGRTRLGPVLAGMADLVRHEDESGRALFDVPEGELAEEDALAPVRLLGAYDNLWLSHAGRDRVTDPGDRKRWMGSNGGVGSTMFVDGRLAGLWRIVDERVSILETFRTLTRTEQQQLDEESDRVDTLLSA